MLRFGNLCALCSVSLSGLLLLDAFRLQRLVAKYRAGDTLHLSGRRARLAGPLTAAKVRNRSNIVVPDGARVRITCDAGL